MNLKQDFQFHQDSNYLNVWNNSKTSSFQLNDINKIRVFDHFFDAKDLFYKIEYNITYISNLKRMDYQPISQLMIVKTHIRFLYDKLFSFHIKGYYITKNHIVLCGPPDARTLMKAYKNNPQITLYKLLSLINNLDTTKKLIEKAQELS